MPWADDLSSCVTDVIASRPADPLGQLAHLLSQPSARPDWEETASAYAVRHNLEQRLGAALDAAGLTVTQDAPPDAIDRIHQAFTWDEAPIPRLDVPQPNRPRGEQRRERVDVVELVDGRDDGGGGARLNDAVISEETQTIGSQDIGENGALKLSAGKKRHLLVRSQS